MGWPSSRKSSPSITPQFAWRIALAAGFAQGADTQHPEKLFLRSAVALVQDAGTGETTIRVDVSYGDGVYRSEDGGKSWKNMGLKASEHIGEIIVDPRNSKHLYLAMSGGGVHESTDGGRSFAPLLKGLEVVEGFDVVDPTFHDPHCVRLCPSNPDRLYQQNHCGIYRLDRPATTWQRIGRNMPAEVGDIGFPLVVHPRDADTAWVFPMDGQTVWPRTSVEGKPAVYGTGNGGKMMAEQNHFVGGVKIHTVIQPHGGSDMLVIEFDNLPGYPDNLMRGQDGRIWMGLVKPRNPKVDAMADKPWLRKLTLRLPRALWPVPKAYGHVFAFTEGGDVVADLQDPSGSYPETTGVTETADRLYVQNLHLHSIGWLAR